MKKNLPILIFVLAILGLTGFLLFRPAGRVDLTPYVKGSAAKFVVFDAPKSLPNTPFFDREGKALRFKDFEGQTLLVNFWATWCEPCKEEMPTLNTLEKELGGGNFKVIAVSIDWQGYSVMDPFFEEFKIDALEPYWDKSGRLPNELDTIGLPLTILISANGDWLARVDGPLVWDSPDVKALLKAAAKPGN